MYISELKLWNFRKYGSVSDLNRNPDLIVPFNKGLNVLIGENDSGKTAIIDAIKLVLKTHAYEWIKVEETDFYVDENNNRSDILQIVLEFSGISDEEARHFSEWSGCAEEGLVKEMRPKLILIYRVEIKEGRILPTDVRAGMDGIGHPLNADAREYLKITYLKALRDAENELTAKKYSRLSEILQKHRLFKKEKNKPHSFEEDFKKINDDIEKHFKGNGKEKKYYEEIKSKIDNYLSKFIDNSTFSDFSLGPPNIKNILEKLNLGIENKSNLGLGTMNRLYMAAELLHLNKELNVLKSCLIEELEAHLHPQAQLKIIEVLKEEAEKNKIQFILTTHSPNIASKVDLKSLIICKDNYVFPLGEGETKLEPKNYSYLKRFLDVTKSNLFFAKGVIIVEGWSEEILLPVLAKKIGYDLTKEEISIVNVASTAYLHFAKIFLRNKGEQLKIPVSIITDLDNRPEADGTFDLIKSKLKKDSIKNKIGDINNTTLELFTAKEWTLEWCLFKSATLSDLFKDSLFKIHSKTTEFGKKINNKQLEVYDETAFTKKLTEKLKNKSIKKVQFANEFVELLENDSIIKKEHLKKDEYLDYLVKAIEHVCRNEK